MNLDNKSYQKILRVYLKNLSKIKSDDRIHFCMRMFRVTGEEKYLLSIKQELTKNLLKIFERLDLVEHIDEIYIDPTDDVRPSMRRNKYQKTRVERREKYYQKNPQLKYLFENLSKLDLLYDLKLDKGLYKEKILRVRKKFSAINWQQRMISTDHLSIHPVLYINSIYRIKRIFGVDFKSALIKQIDHNYPPEKILKGELLYDQVYAYTHLIINESSFYQKFLSKKQVNEFSWIFDFFVRNFFEIYKKINLDLIIEILICFQLAKIGNGKTSIIINESKKYLSEHIDDKLGIMKADSVASIEDMEHANILLIMYLIKPNKFYQIKRALI